ncbi:MAG: hypothetical protein L6R19_28325 [Alphaproteobacteria bacterium]|nr:hypothetical protein [Alphaproteobacteria bacterium]
MLVAASALPVHAQDQAELAFWETVKNSKDPAEFQAYIDAYPSGRFVSLARIRMKALQGGGQVAPAPVAPTLNPAAPITVQPVGPARPPVGLGLPAAGAPPVGGIATDRPVYAPFEPVVLSWNGIRVPFGAVGIGAPGETRLQQQTTVQFSTKPSGSQEFDGSLPGKYEARLVAGDKVESRFAFEVREATADAAAKGQFAPRITAAKPDFKPFESIGVTWADIRAPHGWVGLYEEGGSKAIESKSLTFFNRWATSGNQVNGSLSFRGLLPGRYEARILAGEYGREVVVARAPVIVSDDAAPPGTQQAMAVPPSAAPAGPALVDVAKATVSTIGGVLLVDRAKASSDTGLRELMTEIVGRRFNAACAAAEIFTWQLGPQDQPRLERVTATTHQAMRVRGYSLKRLEMDDAKDWLAYDASHGNKRHPDAELLVAWHVEENDLHLMLCRKAPPDQAGDPPIPVKPQ